MTLKAFSIVSIIVGCIAACYLLFDAISDRNQDRRLDAMDNRLKQIEEKLLPNYIWATVHGDGDSVVIIQPMQDVLARLDSLEARIDTLEARLWKCDFRPWQLDPLEQLEAK